MTQKIFLVIASAVCAGAIVGLGAMQAGATGKVALVAGGLAACKDVQAFLSSLPKAGDK